MKNCFQIQFFYHKKKKKISQNLSVFMKEQNWFFSLKIQQTQGLYDGLDDNGFDYIACSQLLINKVFFFYIIFLLHITFVFNLT